MPIPFRAMNDDRLTALDWRALACISWHDRLSISKGGKGCYASNRTMAREVVCNETSFSKVASKLVALKYISRERSHVSGKGRNTIYRVLHEVAPPSRWARNDELEIDGRSACETETLSRATAENGTLLPICEDKRLLEERKEISRRIEEKNSKELAAWRRQVTSTQPDSVTKPELAMLERKMQAGQDVDRVYWMDRLWEIHDMDIRPWAMRLYAKMMEDLTDEEEEQLRAMG